MLITSAIPNLINGVSQQPDTLRLASQAEEQINFLPSVSDGLTRRPGSRHMAKISTAQWTDAFLHTINRDSAEKYVVAVRGGQIKVFDALTGVEKTVNAPSGWGYLAGGAKEDYRAVTVADYTFIINRDKTVAMDVTLSPLRPNTSLAYFRGGNYSRTYTVAITGVTNGYGSYTTPDGSVAAHAADARTTVLANRVMLNFAVNGPNAATAAGYTVSQFSDILQISRNDQNAFTITTSDDVGGTNLVPIGRSIQRFSDLPKNGVEGFHTEIVGDNQSGFDNYYVKYTGGVWKETLKGGEKYRLSAATMPHVLVREGDGTFTFRPATWAERKVGDAEKIPEPSFVGRKISDVFFYRNRLGLLSDENVILSKQGEFFDFFRDTATTVLDTDPIDIAVSTTKVSLLNHALPFNETLLLFSDGAQFVMGGGDILTAATAFVSQSTEFESLPGVRPVGAGQNVYFPVQRGSFTGVREYFVAENTEQNDALDITSHCPRYIPAGLTKLAATTSEDVLVGITPVTPNTLWVYRYFSGDEGKLQSAWSRWNFAADVTLLSCDFVENYLFLVISRSDGTFLERVDIESGAVDDGASFHYHVDSGVYLTGGVYDAVNQWTTYTLPYATSEPLWVIQMSTPEGLAVLHTRPTTTTVRIAGDWTAKTLFCGVKFESFYRFSTFYIRESSAGGGTSAATAGRLQVRRLSINYAKSGYFKVVTTPLGRDPSYREFTARQLGTLSAELATVQLSDGRFSCPVMSRNTTVTVDIISDSFLPAAFTSAEWEATYHTRAQRA
jgi:hypothetical protein